MTSTLTPALSALRRCSAREFGTQILSVLLLVGSALSFSSPPIVMLSDSYIISRLRLHKTL